MSAIFRAELASLQRLVAANAAAQAQATSEAAATREAIRLRNIENAKKNKAKITTQQIVLDFLRRQQEPVSYYRVAEQTGISPATAERHLTALSEEGTATVVGAGNGRRKYILDRSRSIK